MLRALIGSYSVTKVFHPSPLPSLPAQTRLRFLQNERQARGIDGISHVMIEASGLQLDSYVTKPGIEMNQALSICDREPIHIPGSIQPHGFLLVLDSKGRVVQASRNAPEALGVTAEQLYGKPFVDLPQVGPVAAAVTINVEAQPEHIGSLSLHRGVSYQVIAHANDGLRIIEFEKITPTTAAPVNSLNLVRGFMGDLSPVTSFSELGQAAAREIRRLTGFDRVLIYIFDAGWNGTVVSEDRNDRLPSYLDLRFPASDIPAQARELYRRNRLRLIPDADYLGVPIEPIQNPETGRPLDLSYSVLRSVSPVHVQYMKNMGTGASMSISILRDGKLWGLVSCHNKDPKNVSFEVRIACDLIAQVLSSQLAAAEHRADAESRIRLKSNQTKLLAYMAEEDSFLEGLSRHPEELMACTCASGAAIVFDGQCRAFGSVPGENQLRELVAWLKQRDPNEPVFSSGSLGSVFPPAKAYASVACGSIAASISSLHEGYLLWFRPEVIRMVKWGGDPSQPAKIADDNGKLNPRNSFEVWKEQVRGFSLPWTQSEIDSAAELKDTIVRIVLRRAEELAELSSQLQRSNQELEAFSYSVSHDLRAPFRHIVGFSELLREREAANLSETSRRYISTIIDSAHFAGTLVDNLLNFSQIGRSSLTITDIDTRKLISEIQAGETRDLSEREVEWRIGDLPTIRGDLFMLRLVFQNLISNALKYTRARSPAIIEISGSQVPAGSPGLTEIVFTIRDNGVGFDPKYSDKLFGVFQRLHKMEDFEGTGIGLANVKRIVMRHGGRVWAEGVPDQGAAFHFSLPAPAPSSSQKQSKK